MKLNRPGGGSGGIGDLQSAINYRFSDASLLVEALTHSSTLTTGRRETSRKAHVRSNERLEFLGDRVLGLAVANLLIEAYPSEAEGGLTHRHSMLVRRETLAEVAGEIGLARWINVAHGGRGSGGVTNPTILADACEALIGAVFLDGGYPPAAALVSRYWHRRIMELTESPRDAKTMLQVWALARLRGLPSYKLISSRGPAHAPVFTVAVEIEGVGSAIAEAGAKRGAEQAAAARLLEKLEGPADG